MGGSGKIGKGQIGPGQPISRVGQSPDIVKVRADAALGCPDPAHIRRSTPQFARPESAMELFGQNGLAHFGVKLAVEPGDEPAGLCPLGWSSSDKRQPGGAARLLQIFAYGFNADDNAAIVLDDDRSGTGRV